MTFSVRVGPHRTSNRLKPSAGTSKRDAQRVVACIDGSELGERVLPHARALARACHLPLTLLTVLERDRAAETPPDPFDWELRRCECRRYLTRLAERLEADDLTVELEVIEGEAATEICNWGLHHGAAFVALTTHGASGESPWCLASTARKLVECAPGTLLLVPSCQTAPRQLAQYRRVVVPLDGSQRAESALPLATSVAQAHAAELVLVHVVPVPELTEIGPLDAQDVELRDRLIRRNERVASNYLDRVRSRLAPSHLSIRTRILRSQDARGRLTEFFAEEEADLVVLSAHGRSEQLETPAGSVASHLIRFARSPLLIVRQRAGLPPKDVWDKQEDVRLPSHAAP